MIDSIQNSLLIIHEKIESISSINDGIYFILSLAAIIFSLNCLYSIFLKKSFAVRSKFVKILFIPALILSFVCTFDLIFAGDIYPNLSAERIARSFAEYLCNEGIEALSDSKIFTAKYRDQFYEDWKEKSKEFIDIQSSADEFDLIEYHYKKKYYIRNSETCKIIIRTLTTVNMSKFLNDEIDFDEILQSDYDFIIGLTKVPIPSQFLGNYMRWKISSFSYKKSTPYTIKELLERLN